MENQPTGGPGYPPPNNPYPAMTQQDERTWGMLAHLSALAGFVVPFGNIIAPLVIWQIYKDRSMFVTEHAKESLNFQITMSIVYIIGIILVFVLIGIAILAIMGLVSLILFVIAAIKANNGEYYRYPLTIRFIK